MNPSDPEPKCPLRCRPQVWRWFFGASILVVLLWLILPEEYRTTHLLAATISMVWGVSYFFHRSHADDARFMKELLEYFNRRYDEQNNGLLKLLAKREEFDLDDMLTVIDYFNLCAEEWVFRKAGYIYDPVWESWLNGMRQFGRDKRVAELWRQERKTNSYYGFEFPVGGSGV